MEKLAAASWLLSGSIIELAEAQDDEVEVPSRERCANVPLPASPNLGEESRAKASGRWGQGTENRTDQRMPLEFGHKLRSFPSKPSED